VSKTFESLPVSAGTRWLWGGVLHIIPVVAVLIYLALWRSTAWQDDPKAMLALILSCSWVWLGPTLIWYYEIHTLPQFDKEAKKILNDDSQYRKLQSLIYSSIYNLKFSVIFTTIWVAAAALGYYKSSTFLLKLGIYDRSDIVFWIIGLGVVLVSYYTSIGYCYAYKAILLTKLVAASELRASVYWGDGVFGLSFIGKFALKTAWMFFSGWLFVPMLVILSQYNTFRDYIFIGLLESAYLAFTIVVFWTPIRSYS